MTKNLFQLFGYPVWLCDDTYNVTKEELNYVKSLARRENNGGGGNSTSVSDYLFTDEKLKNIKDFCTKQMKIYFNDILHVEKQTELYITQAWANYNQTNQSHHEHHHANSIVSGVFYLQTDGVEIDFFKVGPHMFPLEFRYDKWDTNNCLSYWLKSHPGKLIIFPSTLKHSVRQNKSNVERISIAMNSFVKGYIGDDIDKTGLYL